MGEPPGARCQGCGTDLPAEARFCGRCGRSRDAVSPTVVELTPLGIAPAEQRAVVSARPPDRRRTLAVLGAVGIVAVVAFALTTLTDDPGDDAAPVPTTSSTIPEDPTTTAAPTTAAPSTTGAVTTTSTTPATTTTIPYVNQRRGVVLDEAQRDRSIFVADNNRVTRIELGTGRVTTRTKDFTSGLGLSAVAGRLVLGGGGGSGPLITLPADLTGTPQRLTGTEAFNTVYGASAVDATGAWVVRFPSGPGAPTALRRVGLDGRVLGDVEAPSTAQIAGFLGGRVVLQQFGRIWTMGLDGVVTPYATGVIAAVNGSSILWVGCDDRAACTYRLGTATTPDTRRTSLQTSYLFAYGGGEGGGIAGQNSLSPDAATLVGTVVNDRFDGQLRIVDLATGALLELSGPGQWFAWSPDGDWLVEVTLGGELAATNVRTGRRVTITYPGLLDLRNNQYVLAIG